MNVEDIEKRFRELKNDVASGAISEEKFAVEVKKLDFRDREGRHWRLGASGQWYYEKDGRWIRGEPHRTDRIKTASIRCFKIGLPECPRVLK